MRVKLGVKPRVVILGCSFAGLTTARYVAARSGDRVQLTVVDRKPYLTFVPNIPQEVWANRNPAESLHLSFPRFLERDGTTFLQGRVEGIDVERRRVRYTPTEREAAPTATLEYDFLVIALGARLAFDEIEGFAEHGHTFSDTHHGDEVRRYLHEEYRGGPVAVGSDPDLTVDPLELELVHTGDTGGHRGFYMHTDEWWGGETSVFRIGYTPHLLKLGFKETFFRTGGRIPGWGLPLAELVADHTFV